MDVYVAGGVGGYCVFQSTGGSSGGADGAGFSDAAHMTSTDRKSVVGMRRISDIYIHIDDCIEKYN